MCAMTSVSWVFLYDACACRVRSKCSELSAEIKSCSFRVIHIVFVIGFGGGASLLLPLL